MSSLFGPRVAALFGVAFAVLLFLGVASLEVPREATDQEVISWWSSAANRDAAMFSTGFVALAAVAMLLFVSYLRDRLNGSGGTAGNPMFAVGVASAATLLATAAIRGTVANAAMDGETLPGVDTLRYFPQLAYSLMDVALLASGLCIVLLGWGIKVTGAFPSWLAWASLGAGVLIAVGVIFIGPFVNPLLWAWALAASFAVWRSGTAEPVPSLRRSSAPA